MLWINYPPIQQLFAGNDIPVYQNGDFSNKELKDDFRQATSINVPFNMFQSVSFLQMPGRNERLGRLILITWLRIIPFTCFLVCNDTFSTGIRPVLGREGCRYTFLLSRENELAHREISRKIELKMIMQTVNVIPLIKQLTGNTEPCHCFSPWYID